MDTTKEDPDGPEWRSRLTRCVSIIREWTPVPPGHEVVHPLSSLASDSERNPTMPLQALAWTGLVTAIEHLDFVAEHLTDVVSSRVATRPTALLPVTRAALVGASQTVWLLAPREADQRVWRGLAIAWHEHHDHGDFLEDYLKRDDLERELTASAMADGREALEGIRGRQKAAAKSLGGNPPTTTTMMRQAAEHLSAMHVDPWQRRALNYEWRMSSAAAHTRLWPFFVRPTDRSQMADGGGEVRTMTSSLRDYTQSTGSAVLMASEALRLWRLRSSRPNAGVALGIAESRSREP